MQLALSILVIIVTRVVIIYIVTLIEPFKVARLPIIVRSFAWGVLSFVLAYFTQRPLVADIHVPVFYVSAVVAPVIEESLMFIFPLWLYHFTLARYSGDGMVYGFAVGSGFALAESFSYILASPNQSLTIALSRVISVGLVHASIEGVVGAGICGIIYYRRWKSYPVFLLLFVFANFVHWYFNIEVLVQTTLYRSITSLVVACFIEYTFH